MRPSLSARLTPHSGAATCFSCTLRLVGSFLDSHWWLPIISLDAWSTRLHATNQESASSTDPSRSEIRRSFSVISNMSVPDAPPLPYEKACLDDYDLALLNQIVFQPGWQ
jgi:hypothetical protein